MNELEATTVLLLSKEWEDVYGILAFANDLLKQDPFRMREILVKNPHLSRALFQAQLELGIANLSTGQEEPPEQPQQPQMRLQAPVQLPDPNDRTISRLLALTPEEFAKLPDNVKPEAMKIINLYRQHQPPL